MRAHFQTTIVDNQGNIVPGAAVRLLDPGSSSSIAQTIYASPDTSTPLSNPFTSTDGAISVYCDVPLRVRFGITVGSNPEYFIEDVDLLLPPATQNLFVQTSPPSSPVAYQTVWVDVTGL